MRANLQVLGRATPADVETIVALAAGQRLVVVSENYERAANYARDAFDFVMAAGVPVQLNLNVRRVVVGDGMVNKIAVRGCGVLQWFSADEVLKRNAGRGFTFDRVIDLDGGDGEAVRTLRRQVDPESR